MTDRAQSLRVLIFLLSGLETVAIMVVIAVVIAGGQLYSGEQLTRELAWVPIMVFGLPYLAFVVPAMILVILNRYLVIALGLSVLSLLAALFAFIYA